MNRQFIYRSSLLALLILLSVSVHTTIAQEVTPNSANSFAWSPDGNEFAIFADNGMFIYDRNFRLLRQQDIASASGGWSPDGTRLLADNWMLNADTLEVLLEFQGTPYGWLSGGSQVFAVSAEEIFIWETNSGSLVRTIPLNIQIEAAVGSPDGTRILTIIANRVFIFDANGGTIVGQYTLPVYSIGHYTWSPDGRRIAYIATALVPAGAPGSFPTADLNNSVLYTLSVMDANTGEVLLTSDPLPEYVFSLTWSKNMPSLAGESRNGSVYIWDANTLTLQTAFSVSGQVTGRMAYSPSGGVLAIGVNPNSVSDQQATNLQQPLASADTLAVAANGTVQFVVPEASLERLADIQTACTGGRSVGVAVPQVEANLASYVAQIESAPSDQIPPGCAADLLAVAAALQGQ